MLIDDPVKSLEIFLVNNKEFWVRSLGIGLCPNVKEKSY